MGLKVVGGTGNTIITTLRVRDLDRLFFQFDVATQALDAFLIEGRVDSLMSFRALAAVTLDYTSIPSEHVLKGVDSSDGSGDLTIVPAGGWGWFIMKPTGLFEVRISASAAADSATVTFGSSAGGLR